MYESSDFCWRKLNIGIADGKAFVSGSKSMGAGSIDFGKEGSFKPLDILPRIGVGCGYKAAEATSMICIRG